MPSRSGEFWNDLVQKNVNGNWLDVVNVPSVDAGFRLQPNEMFLRVRAWDTAGGDGDYAIDRGTDYALKIWYQRHDHAREIPYPGLRPPGRPEELSGTLVHPGEGE